jgi:hypothetical protein
MSVSTPNPSVLRAAVTLSMVSLNDAVTTVPNPKRVSMVQSSHVAASRERGVPACSGRLSWKQSLAMNEKIQGDARIFQMI